MARRKSGGQLDRALDLWAVWCDRGGIPAGGTSMLARLIENRGELFFGSSGGAGGAADDLETGIEGCVLRMATESPSRADVLRLEYGAGWYGVIERRGIKGYDPVNSRQFDKALYLGIGLRTYKLHLAAARKAIESHLAGL